MNKVTTLGIDLAKNVFQLHGVDEAGRNVLRRAVRRGQLMKVIAQLEPCLIGVEACGSAHYWARRFGEHGHEVKLMSPQFVKLYRKNDKNDCNDAEAICEAVGRPSMRFVAVKSVEQQDMQSLHRVREGMMKERISLINRGGLWCQCHHLIICRCDERAGNGMDSLEQGRTSAPVIGYPVFASEHRS